MLRLAMVLGTILGMALRRHQQRRRATRRITGGLMKGGRSAVAASTTATIQPSQPSPTPVETPSGPAVSDSPCAHFWVMAPYDLQMVGPQLPVRLRVYCRNCPAWRSYEKTLVPAAASTPSTSARPDSTQSALEPEAAASPSNDFSSCKYTWLHAGRYFSCGYPANADESSGDRCRLHAGELGVMPPVGETVDNYCPCAEPQPDDADGEHCRNCGQSLGWVRDAATLETSYGHD